MKKIYNFALIFIFILASLASGKIANENFPQLIDGDFFIGNYIYLLFGLLVLTSLISMILLVKINRKKS